MYFSILTYILNGKSKKLTEGVPSLETHSNDGGMEGIYCSCLN